MVVERVKESQFSMPMIAIRGKVIGPVVGELQDQLSYQLKSVAGKSVVLNLQAVTSIDSLGVRHLFHSVRGYRLSIVPGNAQVMRILQHYAPMHEYQIVREREAGASLVDREDRARLLSDKRQHKRCPASLEVRFWNLHAEEPRIVKGIATDISLGGMCLSYLDWETAEPTPFLSELNLFEEVGLEIKFPNNRRTTLKGRVVYVKPVLEQTAVGIQFIDVKSKEKVEISRFLKRYGLHHT